MNMVRLSGSLGPGALTAAMHQLQHGGVAGVDLQHGARQAEPAQQHISKCGTQMPAAHLPDIMA
jgi:hypothetical protein